MRALLVMRNGFGLRGFKTSTIRCCLLCATFLRTPDVPFYISTRVNIAPSF